MTRDEQHMGTHWLNIDSSNGMRFTTDINVRDDQECSNLVAWLRSGDGYSISISRKVAQ